MRLPLQYELFWQAGGVLDLREEFGVVADTSQNLERIFSSNLCSLPSLSFCYPSFLLDASSSAEMAISACST